MPKRRAVSFSCAIIWRAPPWRSWLRGTHRQTWQRCRPYSSQAEQAAQEGTDALAEALFRYHRGITFLSGNTITPLLFNAFTRVNLEFWKEYIQLTGIDRCLERLAQFTAHIEAGEGQAASSLLRQGLEQFITQVR